MSETLKMLKEQSKKRKMLLAKTVNLLKIIVNYKYIIM